MPHITFRPRSRPFHRYASQEMSDPLPPVLFKALPLIYAQRLIEGGEMMWSTLTWFRNLEDPSRGDVLEATRRNFPPGGQGVTRLERDGVATVAPGRTPEPTELAQPRRPVEDHHHCVHRRIAELQSLVKR